MKSRLAVALVIVAGISAACGSSASRSAPAATTSSSTTTSTSTTTTTSPPPDGLRIAPAIAPPGYETPTGSWLSITRPDGATQLAAVFRPSSGAGPFPVVVFLHGSSGLPKPELAWAPRLAASGFVVLAGCYLDTDPGVSTQIFMPCAEVPNDQQASPSATSAAVNALVDAATILPGVTPGEVGEVGISLGANLALSADDPRITAIAADSGHRTVAGTTSAPVLLLGMTTDPNVPHELVVAFEQAQRAAGTSIDVHYYPGTGHVTIFGPPPISDDATNRIMTFLHQQLH